MNTSSERTHFVGVRADKQAVRRRRSQTKPKPSLRCPMCGKIGNYTAVNICFCISCLHYFDAHGNVLEPDEEGENVPKIKNNKLMGSLEETEQDEIMDTLF